MFLEARLRSRVQVLQCLHETLVDRRYAFAEGGFWDLSILARSRASRYRSHESPRCVLTPDGGYAFVTLERVGSEPGTGEAGERVGTVDVGKQAGGVAFSKTEG